MTDRANAIAFNLTAIMLIIVLAPIVAVLAWTALTSATAIVWPVAVACTLVGCYVHGRCEDRRNARIVADLERMAAKRIAECGC